MKRRPTRWLDPSSDAPAGVRDLLASAATPDEGARARVWSALGATTVSSLPPLSPMAKGASAAKATAAGAGALSLGKTMILGAALAGALGAGGATWRGHRPHEIPVATSRPRQPLRAGSPRRSEPLPDAVAPPASSPPAGAPAGAVAVVAPPALTVAAPPVAAPPRVVRARTIDASHWPAARSARVSAPSEAPVDEVSLLAAMRAALRDDPARCLALATAHAARFGDAAMLSHERERFAVESLRALAREPEAAARADAFLRAHPTSTVAPRMRALRGAMNPDPR